MLKNKIKRIDFSKKEHVPGEGMLLYIESYVYKLTPLLYMLIMKQ